MEPALSEKELDELMEDIVATEASPPNSTSRRGAKGSVQIMPNTFRQYAKPGESFRNEKDRIAAARRKVADDYKWALSQTEGDSEQAFKATAAAYLGGRGGAQAWIRGEGHTRNDGGLNINQYVDRASRLRQERMNLSQPGTATPQIQKTGTTIDPEVQKALEISKSTKKYGAMGASPGSPESITDPTVSMAVSLGSMKLGSMPDEEFVAQSLRQKKLGTDTLDAYPRAKLAWLADTEGERQKAFKKMFPDGDYMEIPTANGEMAVFRVDKSKEFSKVDPGVREAFSKGTGEGIEEALKDVADASPDLIKGAVDLAVLKGKGGMLWNAGKAFVSNLLTEGARQGTQTVSGTQEQSLSEQATTSLESGAIGAGGAVGGQVLEMGLRGGSRLVRSGPGVLPPRTGAAEAQAAAERLGIEPFGLHQLADSPLIEALSKQSAAVSRSLDDINRLRSDQTLESVRATVDPAAKARVVSNANKIVDESEKVLNEVVNTAIEQSTKPGTKLTRNLRELGVRVKDSIKKFDKEVLDPEVNRAYSYARSIEEPDIDVSNAVGLAQKLDAGVWTPSKPYKVDRVVGQHADGTPMTITETVTDPIRLDRLDPDVKAVVQDLLQIDPKMPYTAQVGGETAPVPASATDRVRALIQRLQDASLPGPEGMRASQYVANDLKHTLQNALDNPKNANPEFKRAWDDARRLAKRRFEILEKSAVKTMVMTETPDTVVKQLLSPGVSAATLIDMKRAVPASTFQEIQIAFTKLALTEKEKIPAFLAQYDPHTLSILLPGEYRKPLMQAAKGFQELAESGIPRAIERHSRTRGFIKTLMDESSTVKHDALWSLVRKNGGHDGELGKSIRSALIDEILERSVIKAEAYGEKLGSDAIKNTLKDMQAKGMLRFLTPGDRAILLDARTITQFQEAVGESVGAAIEATTVSKKVFLKANPWKMVEWAQLASIGRFLTSDSGRKLVALGANPLIRRPELKIAAYTGAALSELARSNERQAGGKLGFQELERLIRHDELHERKSETTTAGRP